MMRGTMKRCSYHYLSINVNNYLRVTGMLLKVRRFLSSTDKFMLLSLLTFLIIGLSLGPAIMGTVLILLLFGLPVLLMNSLLSIVSFMLVKFWQLILRTLYWILNPKMVTSNTAFLIAHAGIKEAIRD